MRNTAIKKAIIILIVVMVTVITVVEISRKYEYKILAQSADALEIQIIDDGIWTSKAEITNTNTQVNNAINDLYIEAIEAGIDIEAVIEGATTQAEAIYMVQGALKAAEQQSIDETSPQVEEPAQEAQSEVPEEETTQEEPDSSTNENIEEEQTPIEETPSKEEEPIVESPSETPPASDNSEETPPVVESVEPTIDDFIVEQTDENDSDSAIVNVSFNINANENEIKKVVVEVIDEEGNTKEQDLELTDDNSYSITGDLFFGNYDIKVVVEYIDNATNESAQIESEVINIDVIGDYILNLVVTEGENTGEIILDLTDSILPDEFIVYDVYIDGEMHDDNVRADENIIVLSEITAGTHDYQVVAKYFDNKQVQVIESAIVNFSILVEPIISNFVINQTIESFTGDFVIDLSFDLQDNDNVINSISATATNVETDEVYELAEITLIESEEEVVNYNNVATTTLPQGTYNFELVVEYTNNENTNTVITSITNYELVAEPQPKTEDFRSKIKAKIEG